jgi:hypothetical protein
MLDFSKLKISEIDSLISLIDLLTAYKDQYQMFPGNTTVCINPESQSFFLVDENESTWIMGELELKEWFYCPICGHEGFKEDIEHSDDENEYNEECQEWLRQVTT